MWAWEVLRRVVRNTDIVARSTDSVARNTDSVAQRTEDIARNAQDVARNAECVVRNTDDIAKNLARNTDSLVQGLPDVLRCLREIADLQKAQLVMLREQSEALHELTDTISRVTAVADTARAEPVDAPDSEPDAELAARAPSTLGEAR
jgi:methyl-accepting chemotaxis protein